MKIAYIDLNAPDCIEDYSVNPKRYGGGRVFASVAKQLIPDFHIYADKECFENLGDGDNKDACNILTWQQRQSLRNSDAVENIIPEIVDYDLIVHHHANLWVNNFGVKAKECCWALGYGEPVDHRMEHLLLYNDYQKPKISNPKTKIYNVVIGKPLPTYFPREKKDFIFQCTRHCNEFGSIQVATAAKKFGYKVVFAGPINDDYPLMDYIDNENSVYLGLISEKEKYEVLNHAKFATFLHSWPTPFNLSAIEALSCGVALITTNVGFWPSLVNGRNGRIVNSFDEFGECLKTDFSQKACYQSAIPYSDIHMISQFKLAFDKIAYSS